MTYELGETQTRVLQAIGALTDEHGYPPTIREIGKAAGVANIGLVSYSCVALRDRGYVTWTRGLARTLRLTPTGKMLLTAEVRP